MNDKTTDLKTVMQKPHLFVWGKITRFHEISGITIAEYRAPNDKTESYHVWVDGKDTSESYATLDSAIVGAIAERYEGPNHHADWYFCSAIMEK